jgi:hypothetical protein
MVLIITQILGGNLGKSNVGFRHLNLTYRSAIALSTAKAIALLGYWDPRVVLLEFISYGINCLIWSKIHDKILGQNSGAVFPSIGQF